MRRDEDDAEELESLLAWVPFDWRWLLRAWLAGLAAGVVLMSLILASG